MATQASGSFDVKLIPQASAEKEAEPRFARMEISKQFHGDLEAGSRGEMLAAMTPVKESAGYVALERVSGTLHGRHGEFTLQHSGTMTRGAQKLSITVVPDSGTGELAGISGEMTIRIESGKHFYQFDYKLADGD